MPTENEDVDTQDETDNTDPGNARNTPPNPATANGNGKGGQVTSASGKVLAMSPTTIDKLKRDHEAKGRRAFVREMGFNSPDEMKAAMAKLKTLSDNPPARQEQPTVGNPVGGQPPSRREQSRHEQAIADLQAKVDRLAREKGKAEKREKELKLTLDAREAELEIKVSAAKAGVSDIDYAFTLYSRKVQKLGPEELKTFNEEEFFGGLREKQPHLFGEVQKPVNTSPTTAKPDDTAPLTPGGQVKAPAAPPQPGTKGPTNDSNATPGQEKKFDARTASPQEVQARLKARGLSLGDPGVA